MELLTLEEKTNLTSYVNNLFLKKFNIVPIIDQSKKYIEIQFDNEHKMDFYIWKSNSTYHIQYRKYNHLNIDLNQSYHVYHIERLYDIIGSILNKLEV